AHAHRAPPDPVGRHPGRHPPAERLVSPSDKVDRMVDLVRTGEITVFVRRAHEFEPADLADVLSALDDQDRLTVVQALPPELSGQALVEMPEASLAEDTLTALAPERAAEIVEGLEDDDA